MSSVKVIIALAAGWRFTPPPRVLAIEAAKPFFLHIHAGTAEPNSAPIDFSTFFRTSRTCCFSSGGNWRLLA